MKSAKLSDVVGSRGSIDLQIHNVKSAIHLDNLVAIVALLDLVEFLAYVMVVDVSH